MSSTASVLSRDMDGVVILTFQGEVREASRETHLIQTIQTLVNDKLKVVMDLNGVVVLPSAVLGFFSTLHKRLGRPGMILCNMGAGVVEQLKVTRLDQLFATCSDLDAAMAHFRQ